MFNSNFAHWGHVLWKPAGSVSNRLVQSCGVSSCKMKKNTISNTLQWANYTEKASMFEVSIKQTALSQFLIVEL